MPRGPLSHNQSTVPGNVFSVLFETAPCADCCVYKIRRVGDILGKLCRSVYVYVLEAAKLPCVLIAVF